jgi:hypothetical protein
MKDKRRNLIFCLVSLALCGALLFLPGVQGLNQNPALLASIRSHGRAEFFYGPMTVEAV